VKETPAAWAGNDAAGAAAWKTAVERNLDITQQDVRVLLQVADGANRAAAAGISDDDENAMILAEGVHTAWRKGTDAPQAMTIHRLIAEMTPEDRGDYVRWLHWALGVSGYKAPGDDDE
jgi:hypothetical protein